MRGGSTVKSKPGIHSQGVSRRDFLSGAGLAAGALTLGASGFAQPGSTETRKSGRVPENNRKLIKGGCVLTLDDQLGDYDEADVLIEGSEIIEIAPNIDTDAEQIDASGMIVMPGFVDTHRHMWQGTMRNILPDGLLQDYMQQVTGEAREIYRPEDAYIGDLATALGAINAGVTTVLDWSHIGNSPAHTDAAIEGLKESGIRGVYAYGGGSEHPDNAFPEDIRRLRDEHFSSDDQLITLAMAAGISASQWELAREVAAPVSVHVNGTGDLLPLADQLGPDVTCIHCCNLLEEEWQLLADTGAGVSIAAPIEMQMGHGIPPLLPALEHGITPSLSVDVETQQPGDFFTQMRSVFALQRMQILERSRQGEEDLPELLSVKDVVKFATIQGARDNHLEDKTGSLTPGKEADIILLRKDRINVVPVNNAYGAVVLGMDTSNVDSVLIGGRFSKWKGELVDVDFGRISRELQQSRQYVIEQTGWQDTLLPD